MDLLDRMLIVSTSPYSAREIDKILSIRYRAPVAARRALVPCDVCSLIFNRCDEEDVKMSNDAMTLLSQIAVDTSLRYAMQIISAADLVRQKRKAKEVAVEDVRKVYHLFFDVKRSVEFLKEYEEQFMFSQKEPDVVPMNI